MTRRDVSAPRAGPEGHWDPPVIHVKHALHDPKRPPFEPSMDSEDAPTRVERLRPRVLVVDDDEAIRTCIERTLARYGYHVAAAAGVGEALGRARTWRPDVLLVDRRLRDGDGLDLARRVRAELAPEAPHVIVCTGDGALHGWTVLPKPFRLHELVEVVHRSFSGTVSQR